MKELKTLIESASKIVDAVFEPEGQMLAHILAIDSVGKQVLMSCPTMADAQEETFFRIGIPETLRAARFRHWVFFAEAWLASYAAGESPERKLPEHRADRLEVVTFAAESLAGERMMASRQIYRAQPGDPGRLMPLVLVNQKARFVMAQPEASHGRSSPAFGRSHECCLSPVDGRRAQVCAATKYAANRAWHELYNIRIEFDRDTTDRSQVCSQCGAPK